MRNKLVMLVAALVLSAGGRDLAQSPSGNKKSPAPTSGYTISLAASEAYQLGAPIKITITVKNVGENEIYWRAETSNTAYKAFDVLLTKDGREVGTTAFHRRIKGKQLPDDPQEVERGGSVVTPMPPGASFDLTIDLATLYKVTAPGLYSVAVSRTEEETGTVTHSNKITLKIQ